MQPTYLVFDTETTGLHDRKLPINHKDQPYIVQLAAVMYDSDWNVVSEMNLIIEPDNWSVPNSAAEIHGVPTEKAQAYGVPIATALHTFLGLWKKATHIVGQNIGYDIKMVKRYYKDLNDTPFDKDNKIIFDTMYGLLNEMKLPLTEKQVQLRDRAERENWTNKPQFDDYKRPTLTEAHKYLFGVDFDNAHTAIDDVKATAKVAKELMSIDRQPCLDALITMEECMKNN